MEKGQLWFIIIVIILIIMLFICFNKGDGGKSSYMAAPKWTSEHFEFQQADTITLSFTYDYSGLTTYGPGDIKFGVGLWDCTSAGACPIPSLVSGQLSPAPDKTVNFLGNDTAYTDDTGNLRTYNVVMTPPSGGLWQTGNYVSYVIATLSSNNNVRSDPSAPATVDITAPGGNPPKPIISSPEEGDYIAFNDALTMTIQWGVNDNYPGFYTFTVQVVDNTVNPSVSTPINQSGISSDITSLITPLTPGYFTATVKSISTADPSNFSTSDPVNFYVKLPSVTSITAT